MDGKVLGNFMAEMIAARNASEGGDADDPRSWQCVARRLPTSEWRAMREYFTKAGMEEDSK